MKRGFLILVTGGLVLATGVPLLVYTLSANRSETPTRDDPTVAPSTPDAVSALPEPKWLIYEDDYLRFPYAETFCGTSWQLSDERELCPGDDGYRPTAIARGTTPHDPSGYHLSFGHAYLRDDPGPAFYIQGLSREEFEALMTDALPAADIANKGGCAFLLRTGTNTEHGHDTRQYLCQIGGRFWRLISDAIDLYPRYERFLLENIEFR